MVMMDFIGNKLVSTIFFQICNLSNCFIFRSANGVLCSLSVGNNSIGDNNLPVTKKSTGLNGEPAMATSAPTPQDISSPNGINLNRTTTILEQNDRYFVELFEHLSSNPPLHSPGKMEFLEVCAAEISEGNYSYPVAVFGVVRAYIQAIMSDAPINYGSMIFVTTDRKCFISCTENSKDDENQQDTRDWETTVAPALGHGKSHDITVELNDENETFFVFNVATCEVYHAGEALGDIYRALVEHPNVKKITTGSSAPYATAIPFSVSSLKILLKNTNLTFMVQKAQITSEQQLCFASSLSRLVFESCAFEENGAYLLGLGFERGRPKPQIRIEFVESMPPLENLVEAVNEGWFKYIGLRKLDFVLSDIDFLQQLHDASKDGENFELKLLEDITLFLYKRGSGEYYQRSNICKLLSGDHVVSAAIFCQLGKLVSLHLFVHILLLDAR